MKTSRLIAATLTCLMPVLISTPASAHQDKPKLTRVVRVFQRGLVQTGRGTKDTCPNASTCGIYQTGRARWDLQNGRAILPFRYNDSGRPSGAPIAATQLIAAASEWNRWNPSTVFTDAGKTTAKPNAGGRDGTCDDGVNSVGWLPLSGETIGATFVCYDRKTYRITDVDTALNSTLKWANLNGPGGRAFDVRSILTHELGHWLSLNDLRFVRSSGQTMYAKGGPGEIRLRTLALGDVLGSQAAYPCALCPRTGLVAD